MFLKNSLFIFKISYFSNVEWHFYNFKFEKLFVYSIKLVNMKKNISNLFSILKNIIFDFLKISYKK